MKRIDSEIYRKHRIICVNAVHLDSDDDDDSDDEKMEYTWYIPSYYHQLNINIGDILVVENRVGCGLAFVKVVATPYTKTREQHESEIHPYCRVIQNLGKIL